MLYSIISKTINKPKTNEKNVHMPNRQHLANALRQYSPKRNTKVTERKLAGHNFASVNKERRFNLLNQSIYQL